MSACEPAPNLETLSPVDPPETSPENPETSRAFLNDYDPPKLRPAKPPLSTEEEAQARRAGRNVMQVIAKEQARLTPVARYALVKAIIKAATSDLDKMDQAWAEANRLKGRLVAEAHAKLAAENAKAGDAPGETAESGDTGSQLPAPLPEEEL